MHMCTCICESQKILDVIFSGTIHPGCMCEGVYMCVHVCAGVCVVHFCRFICIFKYICVCLHSLGVHMYIGICVHMCVSRSKGEHVFVLYVCSATYMYVDACICICVCRLVCAGTCMFANTYGV